MTNHFRMMNVSRNFRYGISVGIRWPSVLMMRIISRKRPLKEKNERVRGRRNDDKTIKKDSKNDQAARRFVRQKRTMQ